jgi:hypothetical protein
MSKKLSLNTSFACHTTGTKHEDFETFVCSLLLVQRVHICLYDGDALFAHIISCAGIQHNLVVIDFYFYISSFSHFTDLQ